MRQALGRCILAGIVSTLLGCAGRPDGSKTGPAGAATPVVASRAEDLYVVDCLLPPQIRKLGRALTYPAPRRPVKTSAVDCEIRGGEYVAYDRADYATALRVWLPLAQEGDRVAQTYVGEIYEKGLGVPPDYRQAALWYGKAAEQGFARAQINLGHLLEKGLGVTPDPARALEWYRRATGLGNAVAFEPGEPDAAQRAELTELRVEVERRGAEAEALRVQLEQAHGLLAQAREELGQQTSELEAERRRVEAARRELEEARAQAVARDDERVRRLETQVSERQAALEQSDQEIGRLRERIAGLERDAEGYRAQLAAPPKQAVALAGPSIEVIEPSLLAMRGVVVVPVLHEPGATERTIVGRATAPAGLLLLLVNGRQETTDDQGLFRTAVRLGPEGAPVSVVAVDRQGKRAQVEFRLAPASKVTADSARPRGPLRTARLGDYHALVIGNQRYRHWPSLRTSEVDAVRTAELLEQRYGFKTRVLIDAGRFQILQALNELRSRLTEKDNLLVYYAGHGYLDARINRAYWIPVDGHTDSNAEWISTVAITDLVSAISAKHVLLVVDSCYSGALTRSALARLEAGMSDEARRHWIEVVAAKRSRTVLSSGDVKPVLDAGGGRHSIFARAWLDVLAKNDGVLEGQRLYREIAARVAYAADALQFEQVPQYAPIRYAGHEAGDFLFVPNAP